MTKARLWQDPANAMMAFAILVSPWAFGYTSSLQAMANAVIVGAMLFTASVGAAVIGRLGRRGCRCLQTPRPLHARVRGLRRTSSSEDVERLDPKHAADAEVARRGGDHDHHRECQAHVAVGHDGGVVGHSCA